MTIGPINSAQAGMRRQVKAFESAIAKVTSATLRADPGEPAQAPPTANPSDQLLSGLTDAMIARRLFMANLRAAEAANEMLKDATEIGE